MERRKLQRRHGGDNGIARGIEKRNKQAKRRVSAAAAAWQQK